MSPFSAWGGGCAGYGVPCEGKPEGRQWVQPGWDAASGDSCFSSLLGLVFSGFFGFFFVPCPVRSKAQLRW